jgi:ABC-2 type transport system ATP-binding protein
MIEVENLSKRYGNKLAVDGLSFVVQPGTVTGFLGPNGAGKSTTMRMIAGLDQPTGGRVTVNGGDYRSAAAPMAELGVLLEAKAVHTGRSARNHLLALAQTNGITTRRVDELIDIVGLREVAGKQVGGFSLGMGQRLGVASALLGNPQTVVLDEPVNGLDPEGVRWMRTMLKDLAADGHTVFVSSHLMSEMAQTATRLVVVGRGRLIADTTVDEFIAQASYHSVTVRTPEAARLRDMLGSMSTVITADISQPDVLEIDGLTAEHIGTIAWQAHVPIFELTVRQASLEEAFMTLTSDSVEYRSTDITDQPPTNPAPTNTAPTSTAPTNPAPTNTAPTSTAAVAA